MLKYALSLLIGLHAGLFVAEASAADLAYKAKPIAAVDNWAGFYLGLTGGANLGRFAPFCQACGEEGTAINLKDNNFFIGGQMFYLLQFGNIVLGPEVGIQYLGFKSEAELSGGPEGLLLQQKVDWLYNVNMRLGFTPLPNALIYLTGGFAGGHAKGEIINLAAIDTSATSTISGFDIGGGLAWKILPNVALELEYRHYDFGNVQAANPIFTTGLGISSPRLSFEQVKAGLNFRLN